MTSELSSQVRTLRRAASSVKGCGLASRAPVGRRVQKYTRTLKIN